MAVSNPITSAFDRGNDDLDLLNQVLNVDELRDEDRDAFTDMKERLKAGRIEELTDKQRAYVLGVADRHGIVDEASLNLVLRGLVPRGREVPSPPVLLNRPLRPPGRR